MAEQGLAATLGGRYPNTTVLFDDTFENGFCGWQPLHPSDAGAVPSYAPLGLSHPSVPGPCLAMVTNSKADQGLLSQCVAMKRLAHFDSPTTARYVDFEVWFAYGGESATGYSPRYLQFMIDQMFGGTRYFWKARWRNVNESDLSSRPMNWYVASQSEDNYVSIGQTSDIPWNGNKGTQSYLKLTIDLTTPRYHALKCNKDEFNAAQLNTGVTPPGADGSGTFDDPEFNNGLNFMLATINRSAQDYMSWMAVTRARGTLRSS